MNESRLRSRRRLGAALAALVVLCAAGRAWAAEPGFSSVARMDWKAGILSVEVSYQLDPSTDSLPRAKWDAEMEIEARRAALLMEAVAGVSLDSARSFGDAFATDPALMEAVRARVLEARREALFLSPDFRRLVARYRIPFFGEKGIAGSLAHGRETPIHRQLGYAASQPFSGILISATGKLPSRGTSAEAPLKPALFPRIFDQDMNLVLDRSMVSPEAIVRWGVVGYTRFDGKPGRHDPPGPDPDPYRRAGGLREELRRHRHPDDAARQILTLRENIELLREGKIVVVFEELP